MSFQWQVRLANKQIFFFSLAVKKNIKIALVGNPNSGKSTIFNALTGLNQKVANFPGVTVDKKTGNCILIHPVTGEKSDATIIDLPGSYSLYPKTPDERIPFQTLCDPKDESYPDLVVIVADASNLKRSLFLASQVIDLKLPSVLVLNMIDMVKSSGLEINIPLLIKKIGIPVVTTNALKKVGIDNLKATLASMEKSFVQDFINIHDYSPCVLSGIRETIKVNSNYAAFQVANNLEYISYFQINQEKKDKIRLLIKEFEFDAHALQTKETLERYRIINELIKECVTRDQPITQKVLSEKLDYFLTHKVYGYLFFLLILFLIFQAIFSWSAYPMSWIESGFNLLSSETQKLLPPGIFSDLLVNGIFAGLSGVVIFVPQIASLFFFIAILEDTGYMARVSFLMDKLIRPFGLNGKSIIPLASGVACAIPAIMSARTISNRKERILTILVTPLMSCSARIPVYTLLISLVISDKFVFGFLNLQGIVLMLLYLIGFIAALGSSFVLKTLLKEKERSYFIMEMPVYRMPRWSNIGLTILEKVKIFIGDAGKVIIAISIILWFLSSFGPQEQFKIIENSTLSNIEKQSAKLENSYAGIIGKKMEPLIKPLGFDWKIGIALITSFAAREVFVGTMSTIYSVGDAGDQKKSLKEKMMAEKNRETGKLRFSVATGFSLMIFYAFALQCMSTIAVVFRETKSWKLPLLQFIFLSGMAYFFSFLVYQLFK